MKFQYTLKVFIPIIIGIMLSSCSKDQNPLPSKAHTELWSDLNSEDFHGSKVLEIGFESCKSCHGEELDGGGSKNSCFECHSSYPHLDDWLDEDQSGFHGVYLANKEWVAEECQDCHGSDYSGGTSESSCFECHVSYPHKENWMVSENDDFHGKYIANADWASEECQTCHGEDYKGGRTQVSCFTCHANFPHNTEWAQADKDGFHGEFIQADNWSMASCHSCHGTDYRGGKTGSSCYVCHTQEEGPEACNTCHGSAENDAPPQDLSNNTSESFIGVGAHQKHLGSTGACSFCHEVPNSLSDAGHIDDTPFAEVKANWAWNRDTRTCTSICHTDQDESYVWTEDDD